MTKKKPTVSVTVPDAGHPDINRLAVIVNCLEAMDAAERHRTFGYLKSRYAKDWPTDTSY